MKAKKSLGQNFLINDLVIKEISDSIKVSNHDLIIEIGPGRGALTKELMKKNCLLFCYEIDTDLKVYLAQLNSSNLHIIYKDILSSNIIDDIKNYQYENIYIVGNLPYYITTPIIKHLINLDLPIKEMVFMVQEEVANRFASLYGTSDYGSITLYLKYYYDVSKLFKVSKECFNPIPKVESAVIKFIKRINPLNVNKDIYFKLIDDAFKMKRKTLKNNLKNYDFNKVKKVLDKYHLPENVRAEELSEDVFMDIANNLKG